MSAPIEGMDLVQAASQEAPPADDESEAPSSFGTKSIWDDAMVEKFICEDEQSKKWRCKWCNQSFQGWNATKVVAHFQGQRVEILLFAKGELK